jgi:hypothetical protein
MLAVLREPKECSSAKRQAYFIAGIERKITANDHLMPI